MTPRGAGIAAGLFIAILALAGPADPQSQAPADEDLERIRGEISTLQSRLDRVKGRARSTEEELAVIDLELGVRTRELDLAVQRRKQLAEEEFIIRREIERLGDRVKTQEKALASRLAALYRLGEVSYLKVLLAADSSTNPVDALTLVTYLVTRDARTIVTYRGTKDLYTRESIRLDEQKAEAAEAHSVVLARQVAVEQTRREKAMLLGRLREEQRSSSRKLAALEEKAQRLERLLAFLYERDDGTTSNVRVEDFKGALGWPIQGRVVEEFGKHRSERFATYTISNGIRIESDPGNEVSAIFEGTVLYSQWFKGYGNLVIVDHGHRIFSLYGNTRAVTIGAGDRVGTGQGIGVVGEGEEELEEGFLYFEIREDNQPVNPRTWLR